MRKIKCFNVTLICPDNTDEGTEYIFVSNASCILKKEKEKKKPEQVCLFGTRQVAGCLCSFKRNLIWRSDKGELTFSPALPFSLWASMAAFNQVPQRCLCSMWCLCNGCPRVRLLSCTPTRRDKHPQLRLSGACCSNAALFLFERVVVFCWYW